MNSILKSNKILLIFFTLSLVFAAFLAVNSTSVEAAQVKATDFKAGNIIDDAVFYNKNAMSLAEIETFLQQKVTNCDTWGTKAIGSGRTINGKAVDPKISRAEYARLMREAGNTRYHAPPYVCLTNYYENPDTRKTSHDTNAQRFEGSLSAAEIIYKAAQTYNINPQVLLVTLKKEYSYAFTDEWPLKDQYNTMMGYACPDSGPGNTANCDSKHFGFYNQMMKAAWQFNYYKENIHLYNYQPGRNNWIQYSPDLSCGSKQVYIENIATASLYIYTPYTPNAASLANYPGTASCGAYGNRNFFMFFNEWFGSTYAPTASNVEIERGIYTLVAGNNVALGIEKESKENSANIFGKTHDNSEDLKFKIEKLSDSSYQISSIFSDKSLDVYENSTVAGERIIQYTSHGGDNQRWYAIQGNNGRISFISKKSGLALTANVIGSQVTQQNYSNANTQEFELIASSPSVSYLNPENGIYNISSKLDSNLVLDIYASSTANSIQYQLWEKNNGNNQLFMLTKNEDGTYRITSHHTNKSMDLSESSRHNGAKIIQFSSHTNNNQKWRIQDAGNGYVRFESVTSGKVLDLAGDASVKNGTKLVQWSNTLESRQQFKLTKPFSYLNPENGIYNISSKLDSNLVLDIYASSTANSIQYQLWEKNNGNNQKFEFIKNNDGTYQIKAVVSGKVMDLFAASLEEGAQIIQFENHNGNNQKWRIQDADNGYVRFESVTSGKIIDLATNNSAKSGTKLVQKNNSTEDHQKFKLHKN